MLGRQYDLAAALRIAMIWDGGHSMTMLYRTMAVADGAPVCGHRARHLGVRTSGPVLDVRPDASGMVGPGGGGCRLLPMIHHTCRLTECRSGWAVRVPTRFG
jgi:hypothetical protein